MGHTSSATPPHALPLVPQRGLLAGSGVAEASCKAVIAQRLKQAGMHWTLAGAGSVIALRCHEASAPREAARDNPGTQARTA